MQNIQRRSNEERQQLQDTVAKIWQKRSCHLITSNVPLAVEGLTDDVEEGLEMVQESLVHALKRKEGIEEIPADGAFDHFHGHPNLPADDEHPADTIAKSSKRLQTP